MYFEDATSGTNPSTTASTGWGDYNTMRIKADFVTNSSTCSYVFAGWECEINEEFIEDVFQVLSRIAQEDLSKQFEKTQSGLIDMLYEFAQFDILHGSDNGVPDNNCVYIGKELMSLSDDDYDVTTVIKDMHTIEEEYDTLSNLRRDGLANGPLKLVMGMRMC